MTSRAEGSPHDELREHDDRVWVHDWGPRRRRFAEWSGAILGLSYPILALSAGARAAYQLAFGSPDTPLLGPLTTALAALLYLVATVGFVLRQRWAWYVSVWVLGIELALALAVGTASLVWSARIGSSVWRLYGIDYLFFPLIQPVLGLIWLLWPLTMARYGVRRRVAPAP